VYLFRSVDWVFMVHRRDEVAPVSLLRFRAPLHPFFGISFIPPEVVFRDATVCIEAVNFSVLAGGGLAD
jgi:hypothetical protein